MKQLKLNFPKASEDSEEEHIDEHPSSFCELSFIAKEPEWEGEDKGGFETNRFLNTVPGDDEVTVKLLPS